MMSGTSLYSFADLVDNTGAFRSTLSMQFLKKVGPRGKVLYQANLQQGLMDLQASFSEPFEHILHFKVQGTLDRWVRQWNLRYQLNDGTLDAEQAVETYSSLLQQSLKQRSSLNLDTMRIHQEFEETDTCRQGRQLIASLVKPIPPNADHTPPRPFYHEPDISLTQVFLFQREKILRRYQRAYDKKLQTWEKIVEKIAQNLEERKKKYAEDLRQYEEKVQGIEADLAQKKEDYLQQVKQHNEQVDRLETLYAEGDADAVEGYFDLLLWQSPYPYEFPLQTTLHFDPDTRHLEIDYTLPHPDQVSKLDPIRNAQGQVQGWATLSDEAFAKRYNEIVYKIMIRVHHELYQADRSRMLQGIRVNGQVQYLNKANGQMEKICIARLASTKLAYDQLNLSRIDPTMCFRFLGGEGASNLTQLESVDELGLRPIMGTRSALRESAPQPVQRGILDTETSEQHLIDVFEDAFQMQHGTLELIRRREDGLTEYMGQDPNPITGGRFILHVKTGTQSIGITVTRELFAAVVSEQAIRGILVAQGELTEEAQDFMRNKPLFMLNGKKLRQVFAEKMQD